MLDLNLLQKAFQDYLLYQRPGIQTEIIGTSNASALARLDIYFEAYYLRLLESLKEDYSTLNSLIGCEKFDVLGRDYIAAYPSHHRSIRWFGKELWQFLRDRKPYSEQLWLSEMAQFEWALTEAFDACDQQSIKVEEMASIPPQKWAGMRFFLHPSIRSLNLCWNVVELWEQIKKDGTKIAPKQGGMANWIVWRKEYALQFCPLSVDKAYMLNCILAGEDFGFICSGLCEWVDDVNVAMHAATLLKGFILDGLITQVIVCGF